MTWTFEGKPFTEFPSDMFGFIYLITYSDGTKYIGKKAVYSEVTLPMLKTGIPRPDSTPLLKRTPMTAEELAARTKVQVKTNVKSTLTQYDVVRKEMPWKKYKGSSKLTAGKTITSKEIIALCPTKRNLTYMEVKAMFYYEAIEDPTFLNENILARFFRGNLI